MLATTRVLSALLLCAAFAHARGLVIEDFDAQIAIDADGGVTVEERIKMKFIGKWNGIFRLIPYRFEYPSGLKGDIRLRVASVTDGQSKPLEYTESRSQGNVSLKIRVPGANNAVREIRIRYSMRNTVMTYGELDEFYWNVTGNGWAMPMKKASAEVRLPDTIPADAIQIRAFTGRYGATTDKTESGRPSDHVCYFQTSAPLAPHEGLTIVVAFPVGHVAHPTWTRRVAWFFADNWPFGVLLAVVGYWIFSWWRRGRDVVDGSIIAEYEPPFDLTATEVGVLADERLHEHDVTACLVDLARRGHVTIAQEEDDDYRITRTSSRDALVDFEEETLDALLGSQPSSSLGEQSSALYNRMHTLRNQVADRLVAAGFFHERPETVRTRWYLYSGGALVALFVLGFFTVSSFFYFLALIPAGIVMFLFARRMPQRTKKGLDALRRIRGMEEYLHTAERDRLVDLPPDHFEKLLPYAIALGLHKRWTKICRGLFAEPEWFQGGDGFSAYQVGHLLGAVNRTAFLAPRTQSSGGGSGWSGGSGFGGGGGFSGGGFGGGGGGGW